MAPGEHLHRAILARNIANNWCIAFEFLLLYSFCILFFLAFCLGNFISDESLCRLPTETR
jgi:hypothetical protein